jgi:VWFA-related protein
MNIQRTIVAVLLAAMVSTANGAGRLAAQQPAPAASTAAPATTLSVDARLVNLPVVVRDKKGALLQNLTKDDFVLKVDGHAQTVRYFNVDTDLPLTLGLLVDAGMSQRDVLDDERVASTAFLEDMLNGPADRDKAFVIQFAKQIDLLQDVTSSKPKLQAALKQIDVQGSSGSSAGTGTDSDSGADGRSGERGGRAHGRGAALYDALFLSSDELMSKIKGRKAVIILSSGVDSGSKETLSSAMEAAQRADTIVYAIYFKGSEPNPDRGFHREDPRDGGGGGYPGGGYPGGGGGYPGGGGRGGGGRPESIPSPDGKKVLQRMADETGGRLFEVSKKESVADIYKEIGEELRAQYRLAFTPDDKTASDGYHKIDLSVAKLNPKDTYVQTRDGYYTGD